MKTVITVIIVVCFLSLGEAAVVVALSSLYSLAAFDIRASTWYPILFNMVHKNVNLK